MIVVDASVAVKWLIEEEGTDRALALRDETMVAPDLLLTEVGNTLRSLTMRNALTSVQAQDMFDAMAMAPIELRLMGPELVSDALKLALRLEHPIYDCVYLALSIEIGAPMITADAKFARRVQADEELSHAVALL